MSDTNIRVGVICKFYMYDTACKEIELKGRGTAFSPTQLHITTESPVNQNGPLANLFVYGTEIHDLLTIDYDAISMLNVSATQGLAKRLAGAEEMIQLLRSENIRLKAQTDKQSGVVDNMKAQIDAINERLNVTSTK